MTQIIKNLQWFPLLYNGLETNIEVTKCGLVRKVKVDWYGNGKGKNRIKLGEIDFERLKLSKNGYKRVGIQIKGLKERPVSVHQLVAAAFLDYKFENKYKLVVDHIDSNKLNNNLDNLRIVTNRENCSKERTIKSGLPAGVTFDKPLNKYKSRICIGNKRVHLGYFNTIEEAETAYLQKLYTLKS